MGAALHRALAALDLRRAAWLTPPRATAWVRVLAAVGASVAAVYLAASHGGLDWRGRPLGTDFVSFYAASLLTLAGDPAAAYDPAVHAAAQRALFPSAQPGWFAFFYPPTFLLLCLPLAMLPYLASLAAWLVAGFAALYACLRRLAPQRWAVVPILAFPGVLANAARGQNAFVTAACLGWAMTLASRRPFRAGLCLGLLVVKPHLLLGAPVVLVAARRWSMIAGAAASGLGLAAPSWLVLGGRAWRGFLDASPLARATLEQGLVASWKMQSVFSAARLLGAGAVPSYAVQGATAVAACILAACGASRRPGGLAEGALLVSASVLCTPFLLDYDLVCLALPLAWVAAEAQRTGWRGCEKVVLLAAYLLPVASRPLAMASGVCVAPAVMFALLLVTLGRAVPATGIAAAGPEARLPA